MNKKQLNTENMKTRISQLAVALLLVASISIGNVNATEHDGKASSHERNETALVLENWMMDETVWTTSNYLITETEQSLEIENWMMNEFVWEAQAESLALENWMTNTNIWEVKSACEAATEEDADLSTEQWMTNENIWKI